VDWWSNRGKCEQGLRLGNARYWNVSQGRKDDGRRQKEGRSIWIRHERSMRPGSWQENAVYLGVW